MNHLLLTAYLLVTLFPLANGLAKSMSTESRDLTGKVSRTTTRQDLRDLDTAGRFNP